MGRIMKNSCMILSVSDRWLTNGPNPSRCGLSGIRLSAPQKEPGSQHTRQRPPPGGRGGWKGGVPDGTIAGEFEPQPHAGRRPGCPGRLDSEGEGLSAVRQHQNLGIHGKWQELPERKPCLLHLRAHVGGSRRLSQRTLRKNTGQERAPVPFLCCVCCGVFFAVRLLW